MGYGIARPLAIAVLSQRIANLPGRIDDPSLLRVIVKQRADSDPIDEGLAIGLDVPLSSVERLTIAVDVPFHSQSI
jgi:hypothetical protein